MPLATDAMPIRIRAARPTDERAVRELCARIWPDDYVPRVFRKWVKDRRGRLWVATVDARVVAVAKLTVLPAGEAWLHALRVDPRYHRRGIGGALFAHRVARAERLGVRVARFDTTRVALRKIARRHGFRVRERYRFFGVPARAGVAPRLARSPEIAQLWRLTKQSDGLLHEPYVYRSVARRDVTRAIRERRCVVADANGRPAAFAIIEAQDDRLGIPFVAGRAHAVTALLRALPAEARRRKRPRVAIAAPSLFWRAARAAGYRLRWDEVMEVFEGRL